MHRWRRLLATAAGALVAACGASGQAPAGSTPVRIATGDPAGVYHPLGETLARIYRDRLPGVAARAEATTGSVFNVQGVEKGEFELAFSQGNVAYEAYTEGVPGRPRPGANLRAVAVLYVNAVQIFARRDGPVRTVASLKGRRVGLGAPGSGTEGAARVILEAYGLTPAQLEARSLSFSEVAAGLTSSSLDVGFLVASPPVPAMTAANASVGLRLLAIDPAATRLIRERYPFFRPVIVPRRTYDGQDEDVPTIGVDNLLVCRADLDEELVHGLTKALVESLSDLARVHEAARSIDPEQAPATPIPLHPGAARYYRERELFR